MKINRYTIDVHFSDGHVECFTVPGSSPDTVLQIMDIVKAEYHRFHPNQPTITRISEVVKVEYQE